VQLRKKGATQATKHEESVGQFNLIGFVDDQTLFAQTLGGAQALVEAIQEFELWCGLRVNRGKTVAMVVERRGTGQRQMSETLVYMGQRGDLLGTLDVVQILGGVGNTHRGYVKHERENLQEN
jgi:hypothetical protein